jgi:hypothetical protein
MPSPTPILRVCTNLNQHLDFVVSVLNSRFMQTATRWTPTPPPVGLPARLPGKSQSAIIASEAVNIVCDTSRFVVASCYIYEGKINLPEKRTAKWL